MELYSNEIIELINQLDPQHVLLSSGSVKFTAQMLLDNSQQLAISLSKNGMKKDDKVVIASEMGQEFVEIMFATMMIGCQVAIIDPEMGRQNYAAKLKQFQPQWVFLDSRIALLQEHPLLRLLYFKLRKFGLYFPKSKNIFPILTGPWTPVLQKHLRLSNLKKEHYGDKVSHKNVTALPYLVTYTSGTLSEPKGVLHTTASLCSSLQIIAQLIISDQKQVMATHLPHFMLVAACAGVSTKLWDVKWSPKKRFDFIQENEISILFGPPSEHLELLTFCESKQTQLPNCLKHIILGSAPVDKIFLKRLYQFLPNDAKVTCIYGMTENLIVCTIDGNEKLELSSEGDPVGKPIAGVQVRIAEDDEILIQSDQLHLRYWHLPNRQKWHPTGDLGYIDSSGNLILKGRKKDMIIRQDFNIYPVLYLPTIKEIEGVEDAVMIGKYDHDIADEQVHLFIQGDANLTEKYIRKKIESGPLSIDKKAWPDKIHFQNIPRSGRQWKVDRKRLRAFK